MDLNDLLSTIKTWKEDRPQQAKPTHIYGKKELTHSRNETRTRKRERTTETRTRLRLLVALCMYFHCVPHHHHTHDHPPYHPLWVPRLHPVGEPTLLKTEDQEVFKSRWCNPILSESLCSPTGLNLQPESCNSSLELCEVPSTFKCSIIIRSHKKSSITELSDYRLIALTSAVRKSFKQLLLNYS